MKSITPIADAIASRQGPAAAPRSMEDLTEASLTKLAVEFEGKGPIALQPARAIPPASLKPPQAPRASVSETVAAWAARVTAEAPARHHRDFGEYMLERLPELVATLEAR